MTAAHWRSARIATLSIALGIATALVLLGMRASPRLSELPATAAPADRPLWRFAFVGDTHGGGPQVEKLLAQIAVEQPEFLLHLGDMVDRGDDPQQWQALLAATRRCGLRVMPVVGNHDRAGGDCGESCFTRYFPEIEGTCYQFEHRGLRFLMLNSERAFCPGSSQAAFLAKQRLQSPLPTVVCLHRPVFTASGRDAPRVLLRRMWLHPQLRELDSLLVLSGHNHYYERTHLLDDVCYVVSGGAAPNLYRAGSANARTARLVEGRQHYGVVDVHAHCVSVRIVALGGEQLDTFCLATGDRANREAANDRLATRTVRASAQRLPH